jgi:uncharacterized protein YndB with AHSA1/START domain
VTRCDRVKATVFVRIPPADAFEVFTKETDLWWRRGPRYRFVGHRPGVLGFEGRAGGRLTETADDGTVFEVGEVLAWEPGARLVFAWRGRNFAAHERTEVEVRFVAKNGGTEVALEHRGFAALPDTHPVRHGLDGPAFIESIGFWWGDLLTSYRQRATRVGS